MSALRKKVVRVIIAKIGFRVDLIFAQKEVTLQKKLVEKGFALYIVGSKC